MEFYIDLKTSKSFRLASLTLLTVHLPLSRLVLCNNFVAAI